MLNRPFTVSSSVKRREAEQKEKEQKNNIGVYTTWFTRMEVNLKSFFKSLIKYYINWKY